MKGATLLGDKLQAAGYDTFSAQFKLMAADALKSRPESIIAAWQSLGATFGYSYLRELHQEMGLNVPPSPPEPAVKVVPKAVSRAAQVMRRRQVATKLIELRFGYKMADGCDLADVRAHEMAAHVRDGALMAELQRELPELSGNMRFAKLGELLTREQVAKAIQNAGLGGTGPATA